MAEILIVVKYEQKEKILFHADHTIPKINLDLNNEEMVGSIQKAAREINWVWISKLEGC